MKKVLKEMKPTAKVVGALLACASITGLYILVFSPKGEDSIKGTEVLSSGHTAPKSKITPTSDGILVTAKFAFGLK